MADLNNELTAEDQFLAYHNKLRNQLTIANWSYKIYKYFASIYKDYRNEIDYSPHFFNLTISAHIISTVARLNTFFDKRRNHLSISRLLDFVEENLEIFSKQVFAKRLQAKGIYDSSWIKDHTEVTKQIVEEHRKIIRDLPVSNLRKWRNELVAHINADTVLQNIDVGKKYPIKTQHLETVIEKLHEILNYYLIAYEGRSFTEGLDFKYEIINILDAIRFDLKQRRKVANLAMRRSQES